MSELARAQHDLREASNRLEHAEDRGDGQAIAHYTAEVDRLAAECDQLAAEETPARVD